jgi:2-polyprenyl-6-methoxyphenol hydroxylase-like FAD-dependent oxidoreductase
MSNARAAGPAGAPVFDAAVHGSGIVAMCAALALARLPLSVALLARPVAAPSASPDLRAYALSAGSVALLQTLKVWDALPEAARTPVHDMRVHGDRDGAVLRFSAWQQGVQELAFIVDAGALEQVLRDALRFAPHLTPCAADVPVQAALAVHAEGKLASLPGVQRDLVPYGHTAIAARLVAEQPHGHLARQWFRHPDVLALLPLDTAAPGHGFGLVWSQPEAQASALMALDDAAFEQALLEATQAAVGGLRLCSRRATWPLFLGRAEPLHGPGWVLLGDAAHVVHPLAGQGLNLGLDDVRSLAAVLAAREPWRALGDERLLARHSRERAAPVRAMAGLTDGLLHLFARPEAPVRLLRNAGLQLVDRAGPLKRWLVAQAMSR